MPTDPEQDHPPARGGEGRGGALTQTEHADLAAEFRRLCTAVASGHAVSSGPLVALVTRIKADQLAAQSPPAGAGAPTDAEWDRAMRDEIERLPRWGLVSRGGEPYELDHTKNGHFLSRADVLRILRDRERDAQARAVAEAREDTVTFDQCDQCGRRAPAGLIVVGLKHYCGGTWQSDAARRAAGGVGSAGSTQVAPWTSAQCARVDGVCALPLECWRQQRCDYTPDTGAGARGRGDDGEVQTDG